MSDALLEIERAGRADAVKQLYDLLQHFPRGLLLERAVNVVQQREGGSRAQARSALASLVDEEGSIFKIGGRSLFLCAGTPEEN